MPSRGEQLERFGRVADGFDHLLDAAEEASAAMRDFAAVELANAHARGKPGYLDLTTYDAPLFRRFFALARAHPLDADLLAVLAARLAFHCGDHDFVRDLQSWRRVQVGLLTAAAALGTFSSADRRKSAASALERAKAGRLCARQRSAGLSFRRTMAAAPRTSRTHQRASSDQ